ncbi:hypothetical protein EVAR_11922_1 [Eumeta japonica]|uniref:Uncharacterized protein n=1 Tax=Eumeta variegata TaxID=151549 RepID=A0A4C1U941_EUMVA|nr:hypothetical protein EVAR_11922_1 [Eumeta japonica]
MYECKQRIGTDPLVAASRFVRRSVPQVARLADWPMTAKRLRGQLGGDIVKIRPAACVREPAPARRRPRRDGSLAINRPRGGARLC